MAALHEALKALGPADFSNVPTSANELKSYLSKHFNSGQLIVDSVPLPNPTDLPPPASSSRPRSSTVSSTASAASEMSVSSARSAPPDPTIEVLQKEWKSVKISPKDNPLGISVYKMSSKDGNGAWFARRSVHEGLGFRKWKSGLEREFPETLKVQGAPGEGNIRGIGGERRVEDKTISGLGKMEVYHLTAQFPGPTAPRDFVNLLLTSDQVVPDESKREETPRHYMVISKPCIHPETAPRDGFTRGSYESVEFIREIPLKKNPTKSASEINLSSHANKDETARPRAATVGNETKIKNTSNIPISPIREEDDPLSRPKSGSSNGDGRSRGKTISFGNLGADAPEEGADDDVECEVNPIEWIMVTRSDPGGSVPRFMVERGTPGGIVADASKFLDWACAHEMEEEHEEEVEEKSIQDNTDPGKGGISRASTTRHDHDKDLHIYQTNGHSAGLEQTDGATQEEQPANPTASSNEGGLYDMVTGMAGAASTAIYNHLPGHAVEDSPVPEETARRSSTVSASSVGSFLSALQGDEQENMEDTSSTLTTTSQTAKPPTILDIKTDKDYAKLVERKLKTDAKLRAARDREHAKLAAAAAPTSDPDPDALRQADERHAAEALKQDTKYQRELTRLEQKKQAATQKQADKLRKQADRDDRTRLTRLLDDSRADTTALARDRDRLAADLALLHAENARLVAALGHMGPPGLAALRDILSSAPAPGGLAPAAPTDSRGRRLRASSAASSLARSMGILGTSSNGGGGSGSPGAAARLSSSSLSRELVLGESESTATGRRSASFDPDGEVLRKKELEKGVATGS